MQWILAIALLSFNIFADVPREVAQPIEHVFVPVGFDDNDSTQIVVTGRFKNSCFQMGPYTSVVDTEANTVELELTAYEYTSSRCLQAEVPFFQVIHLGMIGKVGTFKLVDLAVQKEVGQLLIKKAPAEGTGTDDVVYAPLTDAYLTPAQKGTARLHLQGLFTNSCLAFKEIETRVTGDVVTVLPKIEMRNGPTCKSGSYPFKKTLLLQKALPKTFLLHVRTMGGQAINKVVIDQELRELN